MNLVHCENANAVTTHHLQIETHRFTNNLEFQQKISKLLKKIRNNLKTISVPSFIKKFSDMSATGSRWINMMTFKREDVKHVIGFVNLTIFNKYRCGWIIKIAKGLQLHFKHWVCCSTFHHLLFFLFLHVTDGK